MELAAHHIVAADESGDGAAIVGGRDKGRRITQGEMIGMDEIGMKAGLAQSDAAEQSMRASAIQRVPAHMWNLERAILGLDHLHIALDPAKASGLDMFEAALG